MRSGENKVYGGWYQFEMMSPFGFPDLQRACFARLGCKFGNVKAILDDSTGGQRSSKVAPWNL